MRVRCCVSRNTIGLQLAWHHHLKIMWSSILCMRFLQPGTQPSFLYCIWEEFSVVLWCVFGEGSREAKIISRLVEGCSLPLWDILGEKRVLRCKIVLYLHVLKQTWRIFDCLGCSAHTVHIYMYCTLRIFVMFCLPGEAEPPPLIFFLESSLRWVIIKYAS